MHRIRRFLAAALAFVLLIGPSLSFALDHQSATSSDVHMLADSDEVPSRDDGKSREQGSLCGHGCHFFSHFLGHINRTPGPLYVPAPAEMPVAWTASFAPSVAFEPPYRPPRALSPA